MSSKRWMGMPEALEDLLNEEYYGESDGESDFEQGVRVDTELPQPDYEAEYDQEAEILTRIASTAHTTANQTVRESNLHKTSFCCTPKAIAEFAEDPGDVDTLRVELEQHMSGDCGCDKKTCWKQFSFNEVYSHILTMRDMEKNEKDAYIMGKLPASRQPLESVTHARKKQKGRHVTLLVRRVYKTLSVLMCS